MNFAIGLNHVTVVSCNQATVYQGMIAGFPSAELNDSIIERAIRDARALHPGLPVHSLLPPTPIHIAFEDQQSGQRISYPTLPHYRTIALLSEDAGGPDERALCIVCFSSTLGLDAACVEAAQQIPWTRLSAENSIW